MNTRDEQELTGQGPTWLHYHPDDRTPTHDTLIRLQALQKFVTASGDYSVSDKDDFVLADTSAGNITVTLPRAADGREFEVVKTAAPGVVTVVPTGTDTILGTTGVTATAQWTALHFKATNGNWILI